MRRTGEAADGEAAAWAGTAPISWATWAVATWAVATSAGATSAGATSAGATSAGATRRGDIGRGDIGRGDIGRGDIGRGDIGRGDIGRGDIGRGDIGRGDIGRGDIGRGDIGRGDIGRGDIGRGDIGRGADDCGARDCAACDRGGFRRGVRGRGVRGRGARHRSTVSGGGAPVGGLGHVGAGGLRAAPGRWCRPATADALGKSGSGAPGRCGRGCRGRLRGVRRGDAGRRAAALARQGLGRGEVLVRALPAGEPSVGPHATGAAAVGPRPVRPAAAPPVELAVCRAAQLLLRFPLVIGLGHEQGVRHQDERLHAPVGRFPQRYPEAVPLPEPGHHEQTQPGVLRQREQAEVGGIGQHLVDPRPRLRFDAQPAVLDLDGDSPADDARRDVDRALGRREGRRVVDQLGEQVDEVADRAAVHVAVRDVPECDARVLLALRHRAADDLGDGHRLAPPPARLLATHDDQILRVAALAGGQVVELVQPGQLVGVVLRALRLVEHLQLAVHDGLAAVGDVEEHGVGACARAGLFGRRGDGRTLRLLDGRPDLADLVRAVVANGELGVDVHRLAAPDPVQHVGEPRGRAVGSGAQPGHPPAEPVARPHRQQHAADDDRDHAEHDADDHIERGARAVDRHRDGVVGGRVREVRGLRRDRVPRGRELPDHRRRPVRRAAVAAAPAVRLPARRCLHARSRREQQLGIGREGAPFRGVEQCGARVPAGVGQARHGVLHGLPDLPGLRRELPVSGHVEPARAVGRHDQIGAAHRLDDREEVPRGAHAGDDVEVGAGRGARADHRVERFDDGLVGLVRVPVARAGVDVAAGPADRLHRGAQLGEGVPHPGRGGVGQPAQEGARSGGGLVGRGPRGREIARALHADPTLVRHRLAEPGRHVDTLADQPRGRPLLERGIGPVPADADHRTDEDERRDDGDGHHPRPEGGEEAGADGDRRHAHADLLQPPPCGPSRFSRGASPARWWQNVSAAQGRIHPSGCYRLEFAHPFGVDGYPTCCECRRSPTLLHSDGSTPTATGAPPWPVHTPPAARSSRS